MGFRRSEHGRLVGLAASGTRHLCSISNPMDILVALLALLASQDPWTSCYFLVEWQWQRNQRSTIHATSHGMDGAIPRRPSNSLSNVRKC